MRANAVGRYPDARRLLRRADARARAAGDQPTLARIATTGALTTLALHGRGAALAELDRARQIAAELDDARLQALTDVQSAAIHVWCSEWESVLVSLARVTRAKGLLSPAEQFAALVNEGVARVALGDLDDGRLALERALRHARAHALDLQQVKALHNLAWLDYLEGDLPRALTRLREARELADEVDEVRVGLDLAEVLAEAGLIDDAESTLLIALVSIGRRSSVDRADILLDLARCELVRGDLTAARRHARSAARLHTGHQVRQRADEAGLIVELIDAIRGRPAPLPPDTADDGMPRGQFALRVLAERLLLAGRTGEAATALDAIDRPGRLGLGPRLHLMLLRARIADAQERPMDAERAILEGAQLLAVARSGSGSLDLRAAMAVHARRLAEHDLARNASSSPERVFAAAERWRAGSLRTPWEHASDPELDRLLTQLRRVRAAHGAGVADASTDDVAQAERRVSRRSLELARRGGDRGALTVGARAARTASRDHGVLLCAFHVRSQLLERIDVTGEGLRVTSLGPARAAIAVAMALGEDARDLGRLAALPGLGGRVLAGTTATAAALSATLLHGIPSGERVVIVPTHALASTPWRMLPALADRDVVVSPSASRWVHGLAAPVPSDLSVVALGGPGLQHGPSEIRRIRALWTRSGATARSRIGAGARDLMSGLREATLVHLAAHGTHDGQTPLMSSLLLADGPFVAHELPAPSPDVGGQQVVLAACAVGQAEVRPGDEPLGFAAALLARGVRTVVAPVAPVADDVAAEVMVTYHRELASGETASAALRRATEGNLQAQSFCLYGNDWQVAAR